MSALTKTALLNINNWRNYRSLDSILSMKNDDPPTWYKMLTKSCGISTFLFCGLHIRLIQTYRSSSVLGYILLQTSLRQRLINLLRHNKFRQCVLLVISIRFLYFLSWNSVAFKLNLYLPCFCFTTV